MQTIVLLVQGIRGRIQVSFVQAVLHSSKADIDRIIKYCLSGKIRSLREWKHDHSTFPKVIAHTSSVWKAFLFQSRLSAWAPSSIWCNKGKLFVMIKGLFQKRWRIQFGSASSLMIIPSDRCRLSPVNADFHWRRHSTNPVEVICSFLPFTRIFCSESRRWTMKLKLTNYGVFARLCFR